MKRFIKRLLSSVTVLSMTVSMVATMSMNVSAVEGETTTYPGGVLLYESFTGYAGGSSTYVLPTNQPKGTTGSLWRKKTGTMAEPGYGTVAMQKDNSSTNMIANFPTAYTGYQEDTALVAAQGPNAKLVLEFDFELDPSNSDATGIVHTVSIGTNDLAGYTDRAHSAVNMFFVAPGSVYVYYNTKSYYEFALPEGISFNKWHHYTLTLNLTDENSAGETTYSFLVDGQNMTMEDSNGQTHDTANLSYLTDSKVSDVSKVSLDTTKNYITYLDNVSLYKVTKDYAALSISELVSAVNKAYANLSDYQTDGEGLEELTAFMTAYNNAVNLVTTAFGTYDSAGEVVTAAKTQADVDAAVAELTTAEKALTEEIKQTSLSGGLLCYEPFDGTARTQPDGTTLTTSELAGYNPANADVAKPEQEIAAVTDLPYSTSVLRTKGNWKYVTVDFPAAYNADGHDGTNAVNAFAVERKNAQLVVEYDLKVGAAPSTGGQNILVGLGAKGAGAGSGDGRSSLAAAYYMNLPAGGSGAPCKMLAYRKQNSYDTISTGIELTKWQHHKLTVDLTGETGALACYSLEIDGVTVANKIQSPGHDSNSTQAYAIEEFTICSTTDNTDWYLANLSVYKVNRNNPKFSPAELELLLREVGDSMDHYKAALTAGKITQTLYDSVKNAYDNAISAINSAYIVAQTDAAAAQTALDEACLTLKAANDEISEVALYPLQSGLQLKADYTNLANSSVVKWEDIFGTEFIRNYELRYGESKNLNIIRTYYSDAGVNTKIEGIRAGEKADTEGANASLILEYDLKLESYELSEASTFKISVGNATEGNAVVYNRKDITEFIPDVQDGVWYRFRHQVNVTDENGDFAPTVSTWVNGILVDDKVPWATPDFSGTVIINDVTFHAAEGGLTDEDGNAIKYGLEFWYDNLLAYKVNADAELPVNDGGLVAKIRALDKEYLYSEDAALKTLLDAAKMACNDAARTQATVDNALVTLNSDYEALPEAKTPYRVETFAYTNTEDATVYEAMAGGKITGLYISKIGKKDGAVGTPVVAIYRNGVLIDAQIGAFTDIDMEIGDAQVASLTTALTIPEDLTGVTITGYLMDGLSNLTPLAEKWTEQAYDPDREMALYIAGTSTYADQYPPSVTYPRYGAGESMKKWLDGTNVKIYNAAQSGATTRSFRNSTSANARNWKLIMEGGNILENKGTEDEIGDIFPGVKPGDYVLMGFILNDEDSGKDMGTDSATDYRANLLYFIRTVREKGGIPILNCPGPRATFASSAITGWSGKTSLGSYPKAIRETAAKYGVQLTDVLTNWEEMFETQIAEATAGKTGSEKTVAYTAATLDIERSYYMVLDETSYQWWTENGTRSIGSTMEAYYQSGLAAGKNGFTDLTHKNIYGADTEAQTVLRDLLKFDSALSKNIDLTKYTPVHPDPERGNQGN